MNYLQIEIGGKPRGLKFTQATYAEMLGRLGESTNNYFGFYCIVWGALKINCEIKNEPLDFTFENVCDWCDIMSDEDALKINEAYQSTLEYIKSVKKEQDDKKKLSAEQSIESNA